jgi:hypothetical protein
MKQKGEWIPEKARKLAPKFFPGEWEDKGVIWEGHCPAAGRHSHGSAKTDARVYLTYGPQGQPPGLYCLHNSCRSELDSMNQRFRDALFDKSDLPGGGAQAKAGAQVVARAPVRREAWIPPFRFDHLAGVVRSVPEVSPEWFEARSPVRPRRLTSGEFLEQVFRPGERALIFTDFYSQGDFLWEVGKGGFRLAEERGVKAARSALPTDGGDQGVWFLSNPVTGQWYPNPRRAGRFSRRSEEAVTAWRYLVLECDESKTLRKQAFALREAAELVEADRKPRLEQAGSEKWVEAVLARPVASWGELAARFEEQARKVPGLWFRFLAMAPLAIVAVYSSGGDSWHALVRVDCATKVDFDTLLRKFAKRTLPLLGADPGAMTPVRLTRLPGCTRRGNLQRLIYLNPQATPATPKPIRDLPPLRSEEAAP